LTSLCLTGSFYYIYRSIGQPLSPCAVMITSSLGSIANLVPLTPGSLGIFDAVTIQIPQSFGLDPSHAIAGTLVFRVLTFVGACILGIPGMIYVFARREGGCSGGKKESGSGLAIPPGELGDQVPLSPAVGSRRED
jgi:uncharacterized protein (TIRG00374 family)